MPPYLLLCIEVSTTDVSGNIIYLPFMLCLQNKEYFTENKEYFQGISPLFDFVSKYNRIELQDFVVKSCHCYADDTEMYIPPPHDCLNTIKWLDWWIFFSYITNVRLFHVSPHSKVKGKPLSPPKYRFLYGHYTTVTNHLTKFNKSVAQNAAAKLLTRSIKRFLFFSFVDVIRGSGFRGILRED